jgi:hypothetical protein
MMHGDWVKFNIAVDRRNKLERATNIELLDESFVIICFHELYIFWMEATCFIANIFGIEHEINFFVMQFTPCNTIFALAPVALYMCFFC